MKNKKIILNVLIAFSAFSNCFAQNKTTPVVNTYTFSGKPQYQILTKRGGNLLGMINVELFPAIAPLAVINFDSLVNFQFYDSTAFHRVIPGFVIQGGDPNSKHGPKSTWGQGDPSQPTVNAEFSQAMHLRGTFAAARDANINSANSQFYICVAPQPGLDHNYTIYGHVISGMSIADTIVNAPRDGADNPLQKIEMFITRTGSNDTVPKAPTLVSPVSGTQNVPGSKQVKWTSVSDAIIYHLDVSTDSLFATTFISKDVPPTPIFSSVTGLQGSTTYYWRVKSCNGGHWSAYSPVWNFSTTMNAGVNDLAFEKAGYRLDQNIPNPSRGQTTIKYVVPDRQVVSIKLFDIAGNEIATLLNEQKDKGEYQLTLDLNAYSSGTYFYQMQVGELQDTKKLVLEK